MNAVRETLGFIGLGNMGAPIAERLRGAGFELVVFDAAANVMEEWRGRGAIVASSPAHVASIAQIVLLSLPTPAIVAEVVLGASGVASGTRVTHVIDLSTTGPDGERAIGRSLAKRDCGLIDAPVSGGVAGARAGTLAIMAACRDEDLARVAPVLSIFGKVHHVAKEPGMGQMMKLINNLMSASALAISCEAVTLAVKAGLDPEIVIQVCNQGSGRNSATLDKFPRQILPGSFDAGFTLGLMTKDVELCMAQAKSLGL